MVVVVGVVVGGTPVVGGTLVVGGVVVGGTLVVGGVVVGGVVVGTPVLGGDVLVVGTGVVVGGAAVVVVLPPHTNEPSAEPEPSQASQQLVDEPTQVTPLRASHSSALGAISHWTDSAPPPTEQHVTAPGRPQVERAEQLTTSLWQWRGNRPSEARVFATATAQLTNCPWLEAESQPHCSSAAARAAATAASSSQFFAAAVPAQLATIPNAATPSTNDLMSALPLDVGCDSPRLSFRGSRSMHEKGDMARRDG